MMVLQISSQVRRYLKTLRFQILKPSSMCRETTTKYRQKITNARCIVMIGSALFILGRHAVHTNNAFITIHGKSPFSFSINTMYLHSQLVGTSLWSLFFTIALCCHAHWEMRETGCELLIFIVSILAYFLKLKTLSTYLFIYLIIIILKIKKLFYYIWKRVISVSRLVSLIPRHY